MNEAPQSSSGLSLLERHGTQNLHDFYLKTLLENVIPFWFPRAVDHQHGGFLHCFDGDGSLLDSDKSVWAQGRMSWMLLTLYNTLEQRPEWLEWGKHGIDFLVKHGFDSDGRMFFHLSQSGQPIRKRRYAYSESFAAIACAALFRATGEQRWRAQATQLFRQFVHWNFSPGLMPPKFCGTRPMTGIGPRMIALVTAQSLREDFGDTFENDADDRGLLESWIDRCFDEIETLFVKHDVRAVMEVVAPDGSLIDHFDGRVLNPGHAIEAAWFVMQEGAYRRDQDLIERGCRMLEYSWERGWDQQYGGLFYFRDVAGRPVTEYWHDMKFWWPHNEAIIACLMAYQLTGNPQYARWHQQVHEWSFKHFSDPQHGEWYGYLHRDGQVSTTIKGNLWKSFFHHPRMLWKLVKLTARAS